MSSPRSSTNASPSIPSTCGMGKIYRYVEPVVLLLLKQKKSAYGYDLLAELNEHALTDSVIEKAALYRTLRLLEDNGKVKSGWDNNHSGPPRRVYQLTRSGEKHLEEWSVVLEHLAHSMQRFVRETRKAQGKNQPSH